jgi:hypothetical protein
VDLTESSNRFHNCFGGITLDDATRDADRGYETGVVSDGEHSMQLCPAWLRPLPVCLWPRNVSTTPNGLQQLGLLAELAIFGCRRTQTVSVSVGAYDGKNASRLY